MNIHEESGVLVIGDDIQSALHHVRVDTIERLDMLMGHTGVGGSWSQIWLNDETGDYHYLVEYAVGILSLCAKRNEPINVDLVVFSSSHHNTGLMVGELESKGYTVRRVGAPTPLS